MKIKEEELKEELKEVVLSTEAIDDDTVDEDALNFDKVVLSEEELQKIEYDKNKVPVLNKTDIDALVTLYNDSILMVIDGCREVIGIGDIELENDAIHTLAVFQLTARNECKTLLMDSKKIVHAITSKYTNNVFIKYLTQFNKTKDEVLQTNIYIGILENIVYKLKNNKYSANVNNGVTYSEVLKNTSNIGRIFKQYEFRDPTKPEVEITSITGVLNHGANTLKQLLSQNIEQITKSNPVFESLTDDINNLNKLYNDKIIFPDIDPETFFIFRKTAHKVAVKLNLEIGENVQKIKQGRTNVSRAKTKKEHFDILTDYQINLIKNKLLMVYRDTFRNLSFEEEEDGVTIIADGDEFVTDELSTNVFKSTMGELITSKLSRLFIIEILNLFRLADEIVTDNVLVNNVKKFILLELTKHLWILDNCGEEDAYKFILDKTPAANKFFNNVFYKNMNVIDSRSKFIQTLHDISEITINSFYDKIITNPNLMLLSTTSRKKKRK